MKRSNPYCGGFTLVELLVTMGLMALLGTISIAGYYGAVRGMTDRGVKQDVVSFVRLAQQRALAEQVPTAVFFENIMLREEDQEAGRAARIVGIGTAVRASGRVSAIARNGDSGGGIYLVDEYGDIERSYPTNAAGRSLSSDATGMKLFRMCTKAGSVEDAYSTVYDRVVRARLDDNVDDLLTARLETTDPNSKWPTPRNAQSLVADSLRYAWAFLVKGGTGGNADGRWRTGDSYGTEIASIQLPHGYVFGNGAGLPTKPGDKSGVGKPQFFDPGRINATAYRGSGFGFDDLKITRIGTDNNHPVATVSRSDLDDDK